MFEPKHFALKVKTFLVLNPKRQEALLRCSAQLHPEVLTRGDAAGHIPTELFARVVEIKSGRLLWLGNRSREEREAVEALIGHRIYIIGYY